MLESEKAKVTKSGEEVVAKASAKKKKKAKLLLLVSSSKLSLSLCRLACLACSPGLFGHIEVVFFSFAGWRRSGQATAAAAVDGAISFPSRRNLQQPNWTAAAAAVVVVAATETAATQ